MSKVNAIRKKALDYVRQQDWQNAVKEYKRLADLDQSNPNVLNELGDIHLKTGNKSDAYEAFSRAIDSYTRVTLYNNAVAVCKKVLRLIPARYEVLTKLGLIRKKQGLGKEAESYYLSFFDKLLGDQQVGPADVKKSCAEIEMEMGDAAPVLERVYECMVKFNLKEETGGALQRLYALYAKNGQQAEMNQTQKRLEEIGVVPQEVPKVAVEKKEGVVITEDNIWSESHSEGERISVDDPAGGQDGVAPIGVPGGAKTSSEPGSVYEYGELHLGGTQPSDSGEAVSPSADPAAPASPQAQETGEQSGQETTTQTIPQPDGQQPSPNPAVDTGAGEEPGAGAPATETGTGAPVYDITPESSEDTPPDGAEQAPASSEPQGTPGGQPKSGVVDSAGEVKMSAIVADLGDEDQGELGEEDYRSHYDLGMAYLEMDLLAEAIREYQVASKSPTYQARALEMIGLCFLKQNQPNLAVKQLTKGLQMIGDNDNEALGIKYNLGLAYEMLGDIEQAKSAFEDVYVEDVTFREVAEKIEKYS